MCTFVAFSPIQGTVLVGEELANCYFGETSSTGSRHGRGEYTFPNKFFKYQGNFDNGQKHGAPLVRPLTLSNAAEMAAPEYLSSSALEVNKKLHPLGSVSATQGET